jgi:hypothetical protein
MHKAPKMVNLSIEETSGVDHPAHLHEGWMVVKAAQQSEVDAVIAALAAPVEKEDDMPNPTDDISNDNLEAALAKAQARIAELEAHSSAPVEAPSEDDILKAAPEAVVKMVADLRAEKAEAVAKAAAAEEELTKERSAAADAEAVEKARAWSNLSIDPTVIGPALRRLVAMDESLAKSITDALTAANAQAEAGSIFTEIGKAAPVMEGDAMSRLYTLAKAAVDTGSSTTVEQALADLAVANPSLYSDYLNEKGA